MSGTRFAVLLLAVALALASSSCRLFRKPAKAATPPAKPVAAQPAPEPLPPPEPAKPTEEVMAPPQLPPGQPNLAAQPPVPLPKPSGRPAQPRRTRNRTARHTPASEPTEPIVAEAPKPVPPAPAPQLQQILTPEQQRQCNEAIETSLARAKITLAAFKTRRVSSEQATSIARIRTFIMQAEQARKSDLLTARALAERADVLAQDLQKTVQ